MRATMIAGRSMADDPSVKNRPDGTAPADPRESALAAMTIQEREEGDEKGAEPALVCFRCRRVYLNCALARCDCGETLSRLPIALCDSMPPVARLDEPARSSTQPFRAGEGIANAPATSPAVVGEAITSSDDATPYAPSFHPAPPPPPSTVIRHYRAEMRKKYLVLFCCVLLAVAIWLNLILMHWR